MISLCPRAVTQTESCTHRQLDGIWGKRREQTVRSEDLSRELQGEPGESQPTESTDNTEARRDSWSIQGDFIYRHHMEPRVQLYVPKEETLLFPLNCIDVTRSTHTDLDVMQEKRIDDYWNVDPNRNLSDSWKGLTKFTLLREGPPNGYVVRGEIDKKFKRPQDQIMHARSLDENW